MQYDVFLDELIELAAEKQAGQTGHDPDELIITNKSQIKTAIDSALVALGNKLIQLVEDIKRVADETSSLDKALDYAAVSLGCELMLFDKEITLISCSKTIPVTDPAWKDTMERGYCSFELREIVRNFPYVKSLDQGNDYVRPNDDSSTRDRLLFHIRLDDKSIGYLLMIAEEGEVFNQFDFMACQEATKGVTYAISRYGRHYFSILSSGDTILQMLLSCLTESDIDTVLLAGDFSIFRNMVVLCFQDEGEPARNYDYVRMQILELFPHAMVTLHKNNLIVLVPLREATGFDAAMEKRLRRLTENANLRVGISNVFFDIRDILHYYRQGMQSLAFIRESGSSEKIAYYGDYYLNDLLNMGTREQLVSMRHPAIETLKRLDEAKQTNYISTLRTYIQNDRNIKKSAETLYIHRNTMIHRIEKIQAITGLDFSNHNNELYIWLSLEIDRIFGEISE